MVVQSTWIIWCSYLYLIYQSVTQPSIYGVIVYFLLCHESLNYWPVNIFNYWLALNHGLVTHFPVKTHRRLSTWATTMRIRFVYERRRYATIGKIRHGLATLNSNNSVVYGQKHKVWVLVSLERAKHLKTKIEQIWWNFLFCNKAASSTATPCKVVCLFCCFTSQVNSYGHCGTASSPNHTFSWAGLNKRLTSNSCTYLRL